jgi:hypothetical protein
VTLEVLSRLAIGYYDSITRGFGNAVVTGGITSTVSGFPSSNLLYPSPWDLMKTSAVSGTVTIEIDMSTSLTLQSFGLLNHNLWSAGYSSAAFQHWTGSWTTDATVTITPGDQDILCTTSAGVTSDKFRVSLGSAPPGTNFYLGLFYLGLRYVVTRNPAPGGILQTRTEPIAFEESAGGARHFYTGFPKRSGKMELTWERTQIADVEFLRQQPKFSLLGIIPPEQGDFQSSPGGQEIFFGYVVSNTPSPRGPGAQATADPARYDWTLELEGAV